MKRGGHNSKMRSLGFEQHRIACTPDDWPVLGMMVAAMQEEHLKRTGRWVRLYSEQRKRRLERGWELKRRSGGLSKYVIWCVPRDWPKIKERARKACADSFHEDSKL